MSEEPGSASDATDSARADVWLWAVRLFKTRTQAAEAIRKNQVLVNGQRIKPARQVRSGDQLSVTRGPLTLDVVVRQVLTKRVSAKEVETYLEDRTTDEARQAADEIRQRQRMSGIARDEGAGRPTKRERRDLDEVMADNRAQEAFMKRMTKAILAKGIKILMAGVILLWSPIADAADPPKRSFEPSEKSVTFKISENLNVSAEKLDPATDPATGAMTGLTASGHVIIKAKPKGAETWIIVSCDKATYQTDGDVVVLTGWPVVKSGMQILRATDAETFVRVARADGKWEIKGPHRIEVSFGR